MSENQPNFVSLSAPIDNRYMCCLCFERFPIKMLNTIGFDGKKMDRPEDVCVFCAEIERVAIVIGWLISVCSALTYNLPRR